MERVLGRTGAREVTIDETTKVVGGTRVTTLDVETTHFTGGGNDAGPDVDLGVGA